MANEERSGRERPVGVEDPRTKAYAAHPSHASHVGRTLSVVSSGTSSVEEVRQLVAGRSPIDEMLGSIVREARRLTGAACSYLAVHDQETGQLPIKYAASGPGGPELLGRTLDADRSSARIVMRRRKPQILTGLYDGPLPVLSRARMWRPRAPGTAVLAPVVVSKQAVGVLVSSGRREKDGFSSEDLAIMQLLANHAALALENESLSQALPKLAILEERARIAKELHDGVIQSIYSVGLSLQQALASVDDGHDLVRAQIAAALSELGQVIKDVRIYIFELQPKLIKERGLAAVIREMVQDSRFNGLSKTQVDIDVTAAAKIGDDRAVHVVQILRETLSNIRRHAKASRIDVRLFHDGSRVVLIIDDDGLHFDSNKVRRGQGLRNIEDRARVLGGAFEFCTLEPRGMRQILYIPELRLEAEGDPGGPL